MVALIIECMYAFMPSDVTGGEFYTCTEVVGRARHPRSYAD